MSKNTNSLFKTELLILFILQEKDCYGYELSKTISDRSDKIIIPKLGTMYPILHELLENGYISSYEECIKTRIRVYYHIEDKGREYLHQLIKEYYDLVKVFNQIIEKDTK